MGISEQTWESQDNKSELQRTVKELKSKLKRVEDNERILKAQEELNNILLAKIHNDEKEKNKEPEHNMPKTTPYKRKERKLEFSSHGDKTSTEESIKHHTEKQQDSTESSDDNKNKKNYKPYEEISVELKKLNHLCLRWDREMRRGGSLVIGNEEILPNL